MFKDHMTDEKTTTYIVCDMENVWENPSISAKMSPQMCLYEASEILDAGIII